MRTGKHTFLTHAQQETHTATSATSAHPGTRINPGIRINPGYPATLLTGPRCVRVHVCACLCLLCVSNSKRKQLHVWICVRRGGRGGQHVKVRYNCARRNLAYAYMGCNTAEFWDHLKQLFVSVWPYMGASFHHISGNAYGFYIYVVGFKLGFISCKFRKVSQKVRMHRMWPCFWKLIYSNFMYAPKL